MKNIDFKKILLFALGLVLLFIPTYIAIASYNSQKPSENLPTVSTLTISDPEGRTSTVTSDNDPNGVFDRSDLSDFHNIYIAPDGGE